MTTTEQEPVEAAVDPLATKVQQLQGRRRWHKNHEYAYAGVAGLALAGAIGAVGIALENGVDNLKTLGVIVGFDAVLTYAGVIGTLGSMSHGRQADTIDTVLMSHDL